MLRDQAAMIQALLTRGFSADQILGLHGWLDRPLVLAALQVASQRAATWSEGSVFVHISGRGFFTCDTPKTARPAPLFEKSDDDNDDGHVFWDAFFTWW